MSVNTASQTEPVFGVSVEAREDADNWDYTQYSPARFEVRESGVLVIVDPTSGELVAAYSASEWRWAARYTVDEDDPR